ncbi:MAG: hypothetical protein QM776_04095 [Rhodocyclaceae bacterium]
MRPRLRALALLPLSALSLAAQANDFSTRGEVLGYRIDTQTWRGSPYSRVARVADHSFNLEARPDVSWSHEQFATTLKPRFITSALPGERHSDAWLNEGWLRWRPADGLSLQAGREALLWGPGAFWNPSNPFFSENSKDNAKREVSGHDIARARWQINEHSALSLIRQFSQGHRARDKAQRNALKLDWVGDEASAAALVSRANDTPPDWQGWAQWTASDALLVYAEAGYVHGGQWQVPVAAATPSGWRLQTQDTRAHTNALLGASYTFESNWTLATEYWRNGGGLNDADATARAQASEALASAPHGLADQQLGALLNASTPMRRHYAGLQLINGSDAKTGWTLRYKRNLDDDSGEAYVMAKRDLGDQWQLWASVMLRHGTRGSEYGRWVRGSTMLGVSWFAF